MAEVGLGSSPLQLALAFTRLSALLYTRGMALLSRLLCAGKEAREHDALAAGEEPGVCFLLVPLGRRKAVAGKQRTHSAGWVEMEVRIRQSSVPTA